MLKRFKSVSLMLLLMGLPAGFAMAETTPNDTYVVVQQNGPATGTVFDETGEPLTGASVIVKGTTNGAMVDNDGSFVVRGVKNGQTLRITFIGYEPQEVVWNGQPLDIVLKEVANNLGEAVVIGYGVAKKNDLTGSVVAIKPDDKNKGLVTNAQDMITGKIAGVNVTSGGGTPGGGATIRVRGGASLNASNDPLIVIDGLAMDNNGVKGLANPLSLVNPADIETFTVLKDASATAIYGSRGSNGVIIITTKKGRSGQKAKVSYNGFTSFSWKQKTIDVMDGDEYRAFIGNKYGKGSDAWNAMGNANTDWQEEIYRMAVGHDHNVTVSGGLKNMPYRIGLGYTNEEGILKTSDFERYTASLNLNPTFFAEHLKFNLSGKYMHANNRYANTGAVSAAVYMDPTQPVFAAKGDQHNIGGYWQWTQDGSALNDAAWLYTRNGQATANPVAMLELKDDHARSRAFVGNIEADYMIHGFEDLHIHMNAGADYSTGKQSTWTSPYSSDAMYYGSDGWEQINKYNLSYNAYAQYLKDFNDNHHFDVMLGYEWQHFYRESKSDWYTYFQPTHNTKPGQVYTHTGTPWKTENYLVSFFGRANYTLLNRYLFTATFRYDGSSRFKEHWALFPSFAFAWRIKDEAFLRDVDAVSDLKLRLGYGQTGQQDLGSDYNYFASYTINSNPDSYYPLVGDGHTKTPAAYNNDLKWETTTTYNAGMDFGFWNQRLTFNIDYYYRYTTDLLNYASVPVGNFRNMLNQNIGEMKNQGVEVGFNVKAIQTKNWFWDLGFNFTYNQNEITKLTGSDDPDYFVETGGISAGTGGTIQAHKVGYPRSSFYVFQQVYDKDGLPIEGVYVDRNGDGQINESDRYIYKSPDAPFTFGLTSKLQYKNWDLGFGLRAALHNYVYNDLEAGASNMATVWSYNALGNRPTSVLEKNWSTWENAKSDYFVRNASFLKCDNITLGYSFDNLFKTAHYNGLAGRLYATANNVFTITKYDGIDPEIGGGIDNNIYPRPFSFVVGLSLNF
ncbi:MAG: TonB-dependent receptor [Bacteroidales bacterium]|nr:TonB-dependent receptor [Bacteroidales bacterium]